MAEVKIPAVARTEFGKGAARRTRRAGLVPAVLYGHGADPVHVSLPGHETLLEASVFASPNQTWPDRPGSTPFLSLSRSSTSMSIFRSCVMTAVPQKARVSDRPTYPARKSCSTRHPAWL